jgi:hypothetical protein
MRSYRPISVLSIFQTTWSVMYNKLSHMHTNNILVTEQYGFRKGICTEDTTFKQTDEVLKSNKQKMYVGKILRFSESFWLCK